MLVLHNDKIGPVQFFVLPLKVKCEFAEKLDFWVVVDFFIELDIYLSKGLVEQRELEELELDWEVEVDVVNLTIVALFVN